MGALLVVPLLASGGTAAFHERTVRRTVAAPTPSGPILLLQDDAQWRLEVPAEVVVVIDARGSPHSLFHLSYHRANQAEPDPAIPASRQWAQLPGPATWHVRVDPAGGADFAARIRFEGHVSDATGAPAAFTLVDVRNDGTCVVPGACLP